MCWKQEMAMAYNNLNWAIIHMKRAGDKMKARAKKAKVRENAIGWNVDKKAWNVGSEQASEMIARWKEDQREIKDMIEFFGISRKSNPKRTTELMHGFRFKKGD